MITPTACNKGQNKKTAMNSPLFRYGCNLTLPLCPYCKSGIKNIKFCSAYQRAAVFDNKKRPSVNTDLKNLYLSMTSHIIYQFESNDLARRMLHGFNTGTVSARPCYPV